MFFDSYINIKQGILKLVIYLCLYIIFPVSAFSSNSPEISDISNYSTNEDTAINYISFTATDIETQPCGLSVTITSSNQTILPDNNFSYICTENTYTITANPALNQNGIVIVTVIVEDNDGLKKSKSFNLDIYPRNDPPVNTSPPDISGNCHAGETLTLDIGLWNDNNDKSPGTLTYTYKWQLADDDSGTNLVNISTNLIYTIPFSYNNKYIRAQVTVLDNGEGLPVPKSSTKNTDWKLIKNSAPVFLETSPQIVSMDEDGLPKSFNLLLNANDADNDPITWTVISNPLHGTATVSPSEISQSIFYTPNNNYNGNDSFTIQIKDNFEETSTLTVNVTINPVNDPPVNTVTPVVNGSYHLGKTLTIIRGNWNDDLDTTPGNITYHYQWQRSDDESGSNIVNLTNFQIYTIESSDHMHYIRAQVIATDDGESLPLTQSTTFNTEWTLVANSSPKFSESSPVSITMDEDNYPVPFNLTLNATDIDNDTIFWKILDNAIHGQVIFNNTGTSQSINYLPMENYYGTDSFSVQVYDFIDSFDTLQVNITINSRNDPPEYSVAPDVSGIHHVGETLTINKGIWVDNKDSNLSNLTYNYKWLIADDNSGTNSSIIGINETYDINLSNNNKYICAQIEVTDDGDGLPLTQSSVFNTSWSLISNTAPELKEIAPQLVTLDEDNYPNSFSLTLNATDSDNDIIFWDIVNMPNHGIASVNETGVSQKICYTPVSNYNGNDSFVVQISDGLGGFDKLTIYVIINPRNDPPVNTVFPIISGHHHVNNALRIDYGDWNDNIDQNNNNLIYSIKWQRADDNTGKNILCLSEDQTYTITLADNNHYIRAQITSTDDGEGLPLTQSTTLNTPWTLISNIAPEFKEYSPQTIIMDEDNYPNSFGITLNAFDEDNDIINWSVLSPPSHGIVKIDETGTKQALDYIPFANYNGSDSFILEISDGLGGNDKLKLDLIINPRNDPPINTIKPSISGIYHVGETLSINEGIWSDSMDLSPGTLRYFYQWQRADNVFGSNSLNISNNQDYTLSIEDNFKYIRAQITAIDDGEGLPNELSTSLYTDWEFISNSPPLINEKSPQNVTIDEDNFPTPFNLILNATDDDNDIILWTIQSNANHGTASVNGEGNSQKILYSPDNNYSGTDSFSIKISDGLGGFDTLSVNIKINPRNDPPEITLIPVISGVFHVGEALSLTPGKWNDTKDLNPGTITFKYKWQRSDDIYGSNIKSIANSQNYLLTMEDNAHYIRAQIIATDDGESLPITQSTTINTEWNFVSNKPPSFIETSPQYITMDEDSYPTPFSLTLNAIDLDNDNISWSIQSNANHGVVTVDGTGLSQAIFYTPYKNYNGNDIFIIKISDSLGGEDTLTVNLNINPRNDPPVNTINPDISGIFHVGEVLTAQQGSWNDNIDKKEGVFNFIYNWQRSDDQYGKNLVNISSSQSYTLKYEDNNRYIRSQITAIDNGDGLPYSQSTNAYTSWKYISNNNPSFSEISPQTITMDEDSFPTPFSLTLHATDSDNDPINWEIITNGSHGTALVSGIGPEKIINYTPVNNYNGIDTFTTKISDGLGGMETLTVNIYILPRNDPPVNTFLPSISGDHHVGKILTIDQGNWHDDNDQKSGKISFYYQWQRAEDAYGKNTVDIGDNKTYQIVFTDNKKYLRAKITASDDGEGLPSSQNTTITTDWKCIENKSPIFSETSPISITMDEDSFPEPFELTLHAYDPDGDTLVWDVSSQANYGVANVEGTGEKQRISYIPNLNYNGLDSFKIRVNDGIDKSAIMNVQIYIQAINDAPILSPYSPKMFDINEDDINNSGEFISSIIGSSISDPDKDSIEGIAIYEIDHSNGKWLYSIDSGINWLAISDVNQITALLLGAQDKIKFLPDQKNSDNASFSYYAWDQTFGKSADIVNISKRGEITAFSIEQDKCTINITDVNDRPYIDQNNEIAVNEGSSILITNSYLSLNDPDNEKQDILYLSHKIMPSGQGALYRNDIQLTENESFSQRDIDENLITYKHSGGEISLVQIFFTASDGQLQLTDIQFNIHIIPENDPLQIINNNLLTITEGKEKIIDENSLKVTDVDNNIDELLFYLIKLPENGTINLNGKILNVNQSFSQADINDSYIVYKHNGSESLSDSFSFTITDNMGAVVPETFFYISIIEENDMPVLINNTGIILPEGGNQTILSSSLLATDEDNSPKELIYSITNMPVYGSIYKNNKPLNDNLFTQQDIFDKKISYVHNSSETYMDSFSFAINDISGGSINNTQFSIKISPINDKPVISEILDIITKEDSHINDIEFIINDSETLAENIQISCHSSNQALIADKNFIVKGSGQSRLLNFNLTPDISGSASITITIADEEGATDSESFNINVFPVDDPPEIKKSINDIVVLEDAKSSIIELHDLFTDIDNEDSNILISLYSNTNEELIFAEIIDRQVHINFIKDKYGLSNIILLGESNGLKITDNINITVLPVDDSPTVSNPSDITQSEDASQMKIDLSEWFTDPDSDDSLITYHILHNSHPDIVKANISTQFLYLDFVENAFGKSEIQIAGQSNGLSVSTSLIINVLPVNDKPVVEDINFYLFEDNRKIGQLNAYDIDQDSLTFTILSTPQKGNLTLNNKSGQFAYSPFANENGKDFFTYIVNDGLVESLTASVFISITPVNDFPIIDDISIQSDEDTGCYFKSFEFYNVFSDIEQDNLLSIKITSLPESGHLFQNENQIDLNIELSILDLASLSFKPLKDWSGKTFFSWKAFDGIDWSENEAKHIINIKPVNDSPVITSIHKNILEDSLLYFTIKDFTDIFNDIENDSLYGIKFNKLPESSVGTLSLDSEAIKKDQLITLSQLDSLSFEPSLHKNGEIILTFVASDSMAWSITPAEIIISIKAVGDTPQVSQIETLEDNATDPIIIKKHPKDGLEVNSFYIDNIQGGELFLSDGITQVNNKNFISSDDALKGLIFIPEIDRITECGFDTWSSEDNENISAQSNAAHVSINIIPVDDPPYVANKLPFVNLFEDSDPVRYDLTNVFVDIDNEQSLMKYNVTNISNPELLTAQIINKILYIEFYPDANGTSDIVFEVISNGKVSQSNCFVKIDSVQDKPVAEDIHIKTFENITISENLLAYDVDYDKLSYEIITNCKKGFVKINNKSGAFSYTPILNINGEDQFTFNVFDGIEQSNTATVFIYITPVNNAPLIEDFYISGIEDSIINFKNTDFSSVFSDYENDTFQKIRIMSIPDNTVGRLFINNTALKINSEVTFDELSSMSFSPLSNKYGDTEFSWQAFDGNLWSTSKANCFINITPVADTPVSLTINTLEDSPGDLIKILKNPNDGNEVLYFKISNIKNGNLFIPDKDLKVESNSFISINQANKGLIFVPFENNTLKCGFDVYSSEDGITVSKQSNAAKISVIIIPVDDPPYVINQIGQISMLEDSIASTFDLSNVFYDIDSDIENMSFEIIKNSNPDLVTTLINQNILIIEPLLDKFGNSTVSLAAYSDGKPVSLNFTIDVTPVNDKPLAVDSEIFTGKQGDSIFGQLSHKDVDNDNLTFTIQRQAEYGQIIFSNSETGEFMYLPDKNQVHLSDNFSYNIFDGQEYSNTANVYFSFEQSTLPPDDPSLIVKLGGDYISGNIYTLTLISPETGGVVFHENGNTDEFTLNISPGVYRLILFGKNYKPMDYPETLVLEEKTFTCNIDLETDSFDPFSPGLDLSHIENNNGFELRVIKKNIYDLKMTIRTSNNEEIPIYEPSYGRTLKSSPGTIENPYYYVWTPSSPVTQRTVQSITDQVTTYTVSFKFYDIFNSSESIGSYTVIYQEFASPIDQEALIPEIQLLFEESPDNGGVYGEKALYIASGETNFYPLLGTTLYLTIKEINGNDRLVSITIPPIPLKYFYLEHQDYLEHDLENDIFKLKSSDFQIQSNHLLKAIIDFYTFGGSAVATGVKLHFEMADGKYKGNKVLFNPMINGERIDFLDNEKAPFIEIPMLLNPESESYSQLVSNPDVWLYVEEKGDQKKGFREEKLSIPAEATNDGLLYIKMNHLTSVGLGTGEMSKNNVEENNKINDNSYSSSNCFLETILK